MAATGLSPSGGKTGNPLRRVNLLDYQLTGRFEFIENGAPTFFLPAPLLPSLNVNLT
jgi:hypothetical protein